MFHLLYSALCTTYHKDNSIGNSMTIITGGKDEWDESGLYIGKDQRKRYVKGLTKLLQSSQVPSFLKGENTLRKFCLPW